MNTAETGDWYDSSACYTENTSKIFFTSQTRQVYVRDRYLFIVGGPRISHAFAKELGYDAGFGPGSTATTVASYLAQELIARKGSVS